MTMIDNRDTVAQSLCFLHVVRGEDDCSAIRAKTRDEIPELSSRLRIETRRRLIEKEKLRISDQRARNGEALLLTARQSADAGIPLLTELYEIDDLAHVPGVLIKALKERESFVDSELLRELRVLQLNSEPLAELPGACIPMSPKHFHVAGVGGEESLADLHGRRFSGAVGSENSEAFAALDFEIHSVDSNDITVRLSQPLNPKRGCVCHCGGTCGVTRSGQKGV